MKKIIKQINSWLKYFFYKHGVALALAASVGMISVTPHLLGQHVLGSNYQGFPLLFQSNEDYYMARVQEIVDGHWLASSSYIYEYKDKLPLVFPIGEYLYALPALLFGVSTLSIIMVTKFIFPALLFLLIYFLLYNLSNQIRGDKITAIVGGLLITVGTHFVNFKDTWALLTGQSSELYLSIWTRPVNPITGALFLFIFLILFWKGTSSEKWYFPVVTGIVLGLMPGYIFSWLVAISILGAYVILTLIRRRLKEIKKIFFIALSGILVSLPVWYFWFVSFSSADGQLLASRSGLTLTHSPILNKMVLLQTIYFLPFFLIEWRKSKKSGVELAEWWWFAVALVIGNWLVFNQQIITGRVVWVPHLTQYTIPLAFLTFVLVLENYFKIFVPKLWNLFVIAISGIIVLFVIMTTLNYNSQLKELSELQRFVPFFNWLDKNTQNDCVVLAKEEENVEILKLWIPAFTHCNVYSSPSEFVPLERRYFNYIVNLRLLGIGGGDISQYLWEHKVGLRTYFFTSWSQILIPANVDADDSWLADPIQTLEYKYNSFLKEDFTTALKRYRVDYLASEEEFSTSLMNQFSQIRLLGKFGSVYVYQL